MSFLNKAKSAYLIIKLHKEISSQYQTINSTNDYLNEDIYLKLESSCGELQKFISDNPEYNVKSLNSLFFCNDDAQYIKEFAKGNYDKSLSVAFKIIDEQKYGDLSITVGVSHVLNSLSELKARTPKIEYQKKYQEIEIIHKALANQIFSHEDLKSGLINVSYNGNKVALAYLAYLDSDFSEMNRCMAEQVHRFGLEKVLANESGIRCPWFYKTVDPQYIKFLNDFTETLQSTNVKKFKP